jgi:hypothetical protein
MGSYSFPPSGAAALPPQFALLAPDTRARPTPAEQTQAGLLQLVLQAGTAQMGAWGADRYEQTNHLTGAIGLAVPPFLDACRGAKVTAYRRRKSPRDGAVAKSAGVLGHFARDEGYEPLDPDHPLARILERPNGEAGKWSMPRELAFLALQYMLTGDAPAWCPVNDAGKPVQFYALTSATTQLQIGAGVDARYPKGAYRVTPYSGTGSFGMAGGLYAGAVLPGEEVHRLVNENPWVRGAGLSRLQVGAVQIDILEAILRSWNAFFTSAPMLDAVVMIPGADATVTELLQKQITAKHGGADNHGRRLLIMGGGDSSAGGRPTIQTLGMNAPEMGFLDSFEKMTEFVLALLRVPKPVAGLSDSSNYATFYAAKQQFYELALNPFFLRCSDFLTAALADAWAEEPGELRVEVQPPPLGDLEMEAQELEFAFQNDAITVNEYRKATGRAPVPDGDVPLSVWRAAQTQKFAPPPAPAAAPGVPGAAKPDPFAKPPVAGPAEPPRPANPEGEGSLPPRAKALDGANTLVGSDGGFLVPDCAPGANRLKRRRKKKPVAELVARVTKALESRGE